MEILIDTKHPRKRFCISLDSKKKKQDRLAVLCPGFLDSKDYLHLRTLGTELVKMGYVCVRINPLGIWKSEGNIEDYSTPEYLSNVQQAISFMDDYNLLPFKKILFVGHSLGGLISFYSASKEKRTESVIAIMPPIKQTLLQPEKLKAWQVQGYRTFRREIPDKESASIHFKVPFSYMKVADKYNVFDVLDPVNYKTLLIASDTDDVIAKEDVKKILSAIKTQKQLKIVHGFDHNYRLFPEQVDKINSLVINFFK